VSTCYLGEEEGETDDIGTVICGKGKMAVRVNFFFVKRDARGRQSSNEGLLLANYNNYAIIRLL
jgi:hypothetical protein